MTTPKPTKAKRKRLGYGDGFMAAFWACVAFAFLAGGCATCLGAKACATYEVKVERKSP
jgi:hypothetical protein